MDRYYSTFKQSINFHKHFITNGFKHLSKTNSPDPRQSVPLSKTNYPNKLGKIERGKTLHINGFLFLFLNSSFYFISAHKLQDFQL